ncbi:branched-chain amino acid ABC transporter permease [Burkholderia cenocepacia]|uniref:branched-chain amino acid ABC transporter permease n=1 Tax=Burkholderia cenocepacia TaxID=95486 RepID=UPI000981DD37|nr:branched-chain amino acid ABC transporter permease [Burkholderia cenocepacia]AQQ28092.1 branched-chain amino acid ABC transporter permease [Burkholderia cenocepacia]ONV88031.1 branched-chain amino acid ABC transporter permease [Burkholderia cenocepacia]ONW12711.1 branched-chain amino acid ABC transporter permease [Burkholderia cenocepacia]ONW20502.1 branched-chain amino acid ABC transporter permease [Burkholderia cenocepacia]ONW30715.1 branched-chain amino acid ABC transporter permease [Bur
MSSFVIHLLTVGCLYATMALGLNLQAGYAGLVNFGFIAFSGLGAYAAGIASQLGWPLPSALALALAAAGALAIVVARLGRQLSADYWGIATLAVAEILRTIALNESWLTGGAQGIGGIAPLFPGLRAPWADLAFLAVTAGCLALTYATYRRLTASRFGRALKVMREEPALAVCFGYDPLALKTRASIAGALPAALAGALAAWYIGYVGPDAMIASETFALWTVVMVGGLGSHVGVLVGTLIVQAVYALAPFLKDWLGVGSDLTGAVRLGLVGLMLLACVLWRPHGLVPERLEVRP